MSSDPAAASLRARLEGVLPSLEEMRAFRIWDGHIHLTTPGSTPEQRLERMLELADRMGIERVVLARGMPPYSRAPGPAELRQQNDDVLRAIRVHPKRALGMVYLNPTYGPASLDELNRCVGDGPCIGIKLWVAANIDHPNMAPILTRARELKAVVFQHTWTAAAAAEESGDGTTTPEDLARVAARFPDVSFVSMHSGGNWELGVRALRPLPNIALEISGSNPTAGFVEMAVREVGASRVTYATDTSGRSMSTQLAKVLGAAIPREEKHQIFGENLRRLLRPILQAKGMAP